MLSRTKRNCSANRHDRENPDVSRVSRQKPICLQLSLLLDTTKLLGIWTMREVLQTIGTGVGLTGLETGMDLGPVYKKGFAPKADT